MSDIATDPVVAALRAAIAAHDGLALRMALGGHLLQLGHAALALAEFERALGFAPSDPYALHSAAQAAEEAGDPARAHAYRTALAAQSASQPLAAPADPQRPRLRLVRDDEPDAGLQPVDAVRPPVTFADVGGLDDLKQRLNRSFLLPLRQPEVAARFGKSVGGGLLLYGPPGCGKTFIARALAGEIGARFVSIELSDVLDMWFGESERKLHELFDNARRQAPTVLFIDEVDALGQRRTQLKNSAGRTLVNQLLAEMDGLENRNRDLFVLGATNHPWDLDPALRRPGRFDRLVFVPAPDLAARERILGLKLADRLTTGPIDVGALARKTDGFSGADLRALVEAATELAFERTVTGGREHPVDDKLLAVALRDMRPSSQPWLETARNYALFSNEGGTYDELLAHLRQRGMA